MNREIKFRAWDKEHGMVYEPSFGLVSIKGGNQVPLNFLLATPNLHLMQYTGLKSESGTEIYEGDLIRATRTASPYYVAFEDGCFIGKEKSTNKFWADLRIFETDKKRRTVWEVIGNIYENPELLQAKETDEQTN